MKAFFAAIRFLTILPVPIQLEQEERLLSRALAFFPVIGLLIGVTIAVFDYSLGFLFPPILASAIVVVALVAASGGLHMDGLADTADGFFSSRPLEQILEIMRDSRTGPMGAAAIACILILKVASVASIAPNLRWAAIILMPLAGRCSLVILLFLLPYARDKGLARVFQRNRSALNAGWAVIFLALVGWVMARSAGLAMAAVSLVGTLMFAAYTYAKIRGITGDTLGAACEVIELLPALVAAALAHGL